MDELKARLTFHLIVHTHWDREWYLPRAAFLPRLVLATGDLLNLLERDADARFVLDGQTVLVEDALAVQPDWAPRFAAAVAQHRLEVGPWYVLADELIPSGESLLRNLLQGARDTAWLGVRMNVLYSPDAFGHPAILPTLANEFGIGTGATWRGLGHLADGDRDLHVWRGPDGARLLLYHLPEQGYEIGAALAGSPEALRERWRTIRQPLVHRAVTSHVAVFVGADHHAAPQQPGAMRDRLQTLEAGHRVRLSTLQEYFDAVQSAVTDRGPLVLRTSEGRIEDITGELRWSNGCPWTLQGVHATRARLKQRHGAAELLLQRKAEALVALAGWHAGADQCAMLRTTWRTLLQCQFHDTLSGCCSDLVAREQESRLASVLAMGRELVRTSLHALTHHDADAAREHPDRVTPTLLVWNPVSRVRRGIITAEVTRFRRDIMVGPPSGGEPRTGVGFQPFTLIDEAGRPIPVQVLSVTPGTERIDAARHYPDQDVVDRVLVAFDPPAIPGLGLIGLTTKAGRRAPPASGLAVHAGRIINRYVEVHTDDDGRIDLVDRRNGERYADVLRFVDERDLGDTYTAWVGPDSPVIQSASTVHQRLLATGPLVAAIETRFTMRSAGRGDIAGRRVLIAHADSPVLRVRLELDNRASDHRLRLRVPVGTGDAATAGAAFGFEHREPVGAPADAFPKEYPVHTAPAHRYVAAGSSDRGLALLCPGFFEYEWTAHGDLTLTVQRSVGELSSGSLPPRPGHAGWPTATPDAQEPGLHVLEVALAPLGENEVKKVDALERLWEDTFLPPQSSFIRDFVGALPPLADIGVRLEGHGLIFTSVKPAESGRGVVLRCYSIAPAPVRGRWIFRAGIASAHLLRADETMRERIDLADPRVVAFIAPPRGIVTILVSPGNG